MLFQVPPPCLLRACDPTSPNLPNRTGARTGRLQTLSSLSEGESADFHLSGNAVTATLARFVGVFCGSVALGVAFGLLAAIVTKRCIKNAHAHAEVTIMMCMAYLAFIVADDLSLSGLMAVFFAGVVMSHYAKYNLSAHGQQTTQHVARTMAHLGELLTFMYFGFTILPVMNPACKSADGPEHLYQVSPPLSLSPSLPLSLTLSLSLSLPFHPTSRPPSALPLTLSHTLSPPTGRATVRRVRGRRRCRSS